MIPAIAMYGTLVLRDGCLRLQWGNSEPGKEQLAVFSPDLKAFVDAEGYLAIGSPSRYASGPFRVGEPIIRGFAPPVSDAAVEQAVRHACGEGKLVWITEPESQYADNLEEAARNALRAAEIHSVSVAIARGKMLEELRGNEARRRRCTLSPDASCRPKRIEPGAPIDSWLMVWPPPPPARPRPSPPAPAR